MNQKMYVLSFALLFFISVFNLGGCTDKSYEPNLESFADTVWIAATDETTYQQIHFNDDATIIYNSIDNFPLFIKKDIQYRMVEGIHADNEYNLYTDPVLIKFENDLLIISGNIEDTEYKYTFRKE